MYVRAVVYSVVLAVVFGCSNEEMSKPVEGNNSVHERTFSAVIEQDIESENDLSFFKSAQYKTIMYKNVEYDTAPELATCRAGTLRQVDKDNYITLLNEIRSLHHLHPIIYNDLDDIAVQEAALMMNANNSLEHNPNNSWPCYTPSGASGAKSSNLAIGYSNIYSSVVEGWLIDKGVESLGHRRWILYAGLQDSAIGFVYRASSMHTISFGDDSYVEYVAYPYKNYPSSLVDEYGLWNVSLTANQCKGACYKDAQIRVIDSDGIELEIVEKSENYNSFGTYATLMFRPKDYSEDKYYEVEITLPTMDNKKIRYKVKIVSDV